MRGREEYTIYYTWQSEDPVKQPFAVPYPMLYDLFVNRWTSNGGGDKVWIFGVDGDNWSPICIGYPHPTVNGLFLNVAINQGTPDWVQWRSVKASERQRQKR